MTTKTGPCVIDPTAKVDPEICDRLEAIISSHQNTPGALIPVLQEAQNLQGLLPVPVQDLIATRLNVPGSDIFGTMSFYSMFTWEPKGKYVVRMCQSPPCHVNGSENMLQALQEELGVVVGETTADGLFTLELSACLGVCEVAPAMQINEVVHGNLTRDKIKQILADYRAGKVPDFRQLPYSTNDYRSYKPGSGEPVLMDNVGLIDPMEINPYLERGGYEALKKAVTTMTPEQVVEEVKTSGIRGRGGAGFPAGLKWSFTRPLGDPHKVLEGMAIAGYAVGASMGYIYCRGEYYLSQYRLKRAIEQARAEGLLGEKLFGTDFSFDIEVRSGFGCYICGEETALIESIEGKRGYPRLKPPFPGVEGLWGKPTIVNNVETLASVPAIISRGGAWYKDLGTADTTGTKIYQIIGQVQTPQIVEAPVGMTLRELIETYGGGLRPGRSFKMCQTGGASAGLVTAECLDVVMDYGSLSKAGGALGSGTMLVMDDSTCVVDFLKSVAVFFNHESCGQCTPCREGTPRILQTLTRISQGQGKMADLEFLERLTCTLLDASFCPLGQSAGVPLMSALNNFRPEIEEHIRERKCRAGVCRCS